MGQFSNLEDVMSISLFNLTTVHLTDNKNVMRYNFNLIHIRYIMP